MNDFAPSPTSTEQTPVKQPPWRFGILDAFFWLSWFAAFAFFVSRFGPRNEYFWISCVFMLLMTLTGFCLRKRIVAATVVVFFTAFLFAVFFGASFSLLTFLVIYFASLAGGRSRRSQPYQLRAFAIGVLLALSVGLVERESALGGIRAARKRLPIVDYTSRLAQLRPPKQNQDVRLTDKWTKLADDRKKASFSYRLWELEQLHSRQYADFVASPGFGIARTVRLDANGLRPLDDAPKLELRGDEGSDSIWPNWNLARARSWRNEVNAVPNEWEEYSFPYDRDESSFNFHFATVQAFASPVTLGVASGAGKSIGFIDHGFHHQPPDVQLGDESRDMILRIRKLQLISLIKSDEPVAYDTSALPSMEMVNSENTPTRKLDRFESESLLKLYRGEDIVAETSGEEVKMLGAMRALPRCTECHGGSPGDLLGAFTYRLRPRN